MTMDTATARLSDIQTRIAKAAGIAGRKPDDVTLIAVSKTHDADAVRPLIVAGQRQIGRASCRERVCHNV